MNAREIAAALGGRRAQRLSDGSYLIPCPVPSHGKGRGDRNPSLRISDGETHVLVYCFGGCDPVAVMDELRRRGLMDRAPSTTTTAPQGKRASDLKDRHVYAREQHRKAAWLWSQRRPITDTIAERYLREARGITCQVPATVAFLLARKPEHYPAMIAAFALPNEPQPGAVGEPRGVEAVHLTLLKRDGTGKADIERPKLMIGSPGNLPIVVAPPGDQLSLAVCEGIEDALTVHQATGLGAWAAGAAGRMPALAAMIPGYIEAVTIFAHDDEAGRVGARGLADALSIETFIEGLP
jgi:hypothetical protein